MELVSLVRPASVENPDRMYLMHGLGSDERDMFGLAEALNPELEIICLRAPHRYGPGYAWFEVQFTSTGVVPHIDQAWESVELVAKLLSGDPAKTIVGGFSQGAMMTAGLMARHPEKFSKAVLLSGRSVDPNSSAFPGKAFLAHGTRDDVVQYSEGLELAKELQAMDGRFTFKDYPIGHWVSPEEIRDINNWLRA